MIWPTLASVVFLFLLASDSPVDGVRRRKGKATHVACQKRQQDLENDDELRDMIKCTREGRFELRTCFGGWCFCIDPRTGVIISGYGEPYKGRTRSRRSCVCARQHHRNFYRRTDFKCMPNGHPGTKCYKKIYTQFNRRKIDDHITCERTGVYGPMKCTGEKCTCINIKGKSTEYDGKKGSPINCKCARKKELVDTALTCKKNGNYLDNLSPEPRKPKCVPRAPATPTTTTPTTTTTTSPTTTTTTRRSQLSLCQQKQAAINDKSEKPQCNALGEFEPEQCRGNKCYCADRLSGKKIGSYFYTKSRRSKRAGCGCARHEANYALTSEKMNVNCLHNGKHMTCANLLRRLKKWPFTIKVKPTCTEGTFHFMQCNENVCYCTNRFGHTIGNYRIPKSLSSTKTCACALAEDHLRSKGNPGLMHHVCNEFGDYDTTADTLPPLVIPVGDDSRPAPRDVRVLT